MKYYGLSSAYSRWGWIRLWPSSFPPPSRWWTGRRWLPVAASATIGTQRTSKWWGGLDSEPTLRWSSAANFWNWVTLVLWAVIFYLQGKKEAQYSLDKQILYPKGCCYIVSSSSLWVSWDWVIVDCSKSVFLSHLVVWLKDMLQSWGCGSCQWQTHSFE